MHLIIKFHPHPHSPIMNLMRLHNLAHLLLPIATGRGTNRGRAPHLRHPRHRQPASGKVLGVAEGSGQHVSAFAKEFPGLEYQPTEIEESALRSIAIYTRDLPPPCVHPLPSASSRPSTHLGPTIHNLCGPSTCMHDDGILIS